MPAWSPRDQSTWIVRLDRTPPWVLSTTSIAPYVLNLNDFTHYVADVISILSAQS
jgi:hypothetical protein